VLRPTSPVAAPAAADDVPQRRTIMPRHKFAVGQVVDFLPGPADANVPRGKYTIQRLMPSETKDPQYRVKHAPDGHERAVVESQLAARQGILG
jgi:hypothetical protein